MWSAGTSKRLEAGAERDDLPGERLGKEAPALSLSSASVLAALIGWARLRPWLPFVAAGAIAWALHLAATRAAWSALTALLTLLTLLIHERSLTLPRWFPPLVALAAAGLLRPIFGAGFGQETAVALLAAATWLKGWEAHSARDRRTWGLTVAFLLATAFLRSQSPATLLAVALGWGLVAVGWLQTARAEWGLASTVPAATAGTFAVSHSRLVAGTALVALPLTLLLFVLVPRLEQPLWGIPQDAARGVTGLTERLTPGAISALATSDGVALSLTWEGPPPAAADLYFRALILTHYDGRTWQPAPSAPEEPPTAPASGPIPSPSAPAKPRAFTLLLAPQPTPWLPLPEASLAFTGSRPARRFPDGTWQATVPLFDRTLWQGTWQPTDRQPVPLSPAERAALTALPPGVEPQARALGQTIAGRHATPAERLAAVAEAFRGAQLRYTLFPPLMPQHPADATLFTVRAGFCEHFAHAFAVVARAAGLPTRIVVGYQGGLPNPTDGSWVVRHADAHAWAEVWLNGHWQRVDPTRWSAPERLEAGSLVALAAELPRWQALWYEIPLLAALRQQLWVWQRQWDLWVVGLDAARQRQLWAQLGWQHFSWPGTGVIALLFAAALALLWRVGKATPRDRVAAAWQRVERELARQQLARTPAEPLLRYARRVAARLPAPLSAAAAATLQQLIRYRYGPANASPSEAQALVAALARLRWQLVRFRFGNWFRLTSRKRP